jgi:MFS family permease
VASTLQATAFNWSGLLASRFFLATAEAAFAPGIPYLLSFFYKRNELGLRCGLYLSAAPLATTFAGALAYGITSGHQAAIANWRLLFIIEGIPSVLLAFVAFRYMPDSADTAGFLDEEEKQVAKIRAMQQTGSEGTARIGHISLKEVFLSLKEFKTWVPPLMFFSCNGEFESATDYWTTHSSA